MDCHNRNKPVERLRKALFELCRTIYRAHQSIAKQEVKLGILEFVLRGAVGLRCSL